MIQPLIIPERVFGEPTKIAPDVNDIVDKVDELVAAVNAGLATSNAIVGGPKYVQYTSSGTYGVPAQALTLDRLDLATVLPGTTATVINPADTPLTATAPSAQYVATLVDAGTANAVQVPAFTGSPDKVWIVWQLVTRADSFTPFVASELAAGKKDYAALGLRPALLKVINALNTNVTTVTTPADTSAPKAPTSGQVDDTADTFSFVPNPAYPAFSQYKVAGLPGVTGAVVLDATNSYVSGSRVYIKVVGAVAAGGLAVYVAGSGNIPDGVPLLSKDAFTGVVVVPQPAAPDFSGFDDVANTVSVSHATLPTSELRYDFNGSTGLSVPNNNVISVGNLAGQVVAYARANGSRPEGLRANSQPFTITQADNAPTVTLSSPQAGQTLNVGDPFVLNANPADADGAQDIKKVQHLDNGAVFAETTAFPHTVQGSITAGAHSFTARVYDMLGASGLSNPISITGQTSNAQLADYAIPESAWRNSARAIPESGTTQRSTFASAVFTSPATDVRIPIYNGKIPNLINLDELGVTVNGVKQILAISQTTQELVVANLPAGNNTFEVFCGSNARPNGIDTVVGLDIVKLRANASLTFINPSTPVNDFLIAGDSITAGGGATHNVWDAFSVVFRNLLPATSRLTIEGVSSDSLYAECLDPSSAAGAAYIQFLGSGLKGTGTNTTLLALGTNDVGLKGVTADQYIARYTAFLDAYHAAWPTHNVVAITPLNRTYLPDAETTLVQVRQRSISLPDTRPWLRVAQGPDLMPQSYLNSGPSPDGLHPPTAGHAVYGQNLYSFVFGASNASVVQAPGFTEETASTRHETGSGWAPITGPLFSNNAARFTPVPGDFDAEDFTGGVVEWVRPVAENSAPFDVYVRLLGGNFGTKIATWPGYQGAVSMGPVTVLSLNLASLISGFDQTVAHEVKTVHAGTNQQALISDGMRYLVADSSYGTTRTNLYADSATRTGSFAPDGNTAIYASPNGGYYTSIIGDSFVQKGTGHTAEVWSPIGENLGSFEVFIGGISHGTFSANATGAAQPSQVVVTISGLQNAFHDVTVVNRGGGNNNVMLCDKTVFIS